MNTWVNDQISAIESLQGEELTLVIIDSMALLEREEGTHIFEHPELPFVQAQQICLGFRSGENIKLLTTDEGGIYLESSVESDLSIEPWNGTIFRNYKCLKFPLGKITEISITEISTEGITELSVKIVGAEPVVLKTGEIHEGHNQELRISSPDESILLFYNGSDSKNMIYNQPIKISA